MPVAVETEPGPPLLRASERAFSYRHPGGVGDTIHHLEVAYHPGRIDQTIVSQLVANILSRPFPGLVVSGENGVDQIQQRLSAGKERIPGPIGDRRWVELYAGCFDTRTEHQTVGQHSVETLVDR